MIRMMGRYGAVLTILALLATATTTAPAYAGKTTVLVPEPGYAPKVGDRAVLYSLDNEAIPSDLWCATTSQGCRTYLASLFAEENDDEKEAEDAESKADSDKPRHEEGIVHLAPKTDVQLLARESVELPGVDGAPPVKCHYFAVQILSGPFQGKTLYTLDFHITRLVEPAASAASDGDRTLAATESAPPLVPIELDNPSAPALPPPSSSNAAKPADTIPATAAAPPPIALANPVDAPKTPRVENETPAPPSRPGTADAPTSITLELETEAADAPAPAAVERAQAASAPVPGVVVSTPAPPLKVESAVPTLDAPAQPKVVVSEPADAPAPPKVVVSEPADALPPPKIVVSEPADALPLPAADDKPAPAPRVTLQDVPTRAPSEAVPPLAPLPPLKVVASEPADAPAPAPAPLVAADEAPAPAPRMTLTDEPAVASSAVAPPAQPLSPPITPLPDDAPRSPEIQGAHSAPLARAGDLPPTRPEPNPGRAAATDRPTRPQPASTASQRILPPLFATPVVGSAPEMLAAAQRWDAEGKSLDALASYRRLIHLHPASTEARIAALRLNLLSDALEAEAMEGRAARILQQARALEAKGEGALAREYLQQIITAYPQTPTARQAQERIRTLAVQPRTQPSAAVRR